MCCKSCQHSSNLVLHAVQYSYTAVCCALSCLANAWVCNAVVGTAAACFVLAMLLLRQWQVRRWHTLGYDTSATVEMRVINKLRRCCGACAFQLCSANPAQEVLLMYIGKFSLYAMQLVPRWGSCTIIIWTCPLYAGFHHLPCNIAVCAQMVAYCLCGP